MKTSLLISDLQKFLGTYCQMLEAPVRENPNLSKAAVEWLTKCSLPGRYSWVTNLKTRRISHCSGIQQCLGYRSLDFEQTFEIIESSFRPIYESNGKASLIIRAKGKLRSKMTNANYYQNTVVKDINGKLWRVQQTSTPFRFDENDRVVEIFNLFHLIEPFNGKPFPMRAHLVHRNFQSFPDYFRQEDQSMGDFIRAFLEPCFDFTPKHWRVLRLLAKHKSNTEVGAHWNLQDERKGYECVKAHNKVILQKARERFPVLSFEKAREVALLFQNLGMAGH